MRVKEFKDITQSELSQAIGDFLNNLGISGSIAEVYDLYHAIYSEHEKAVLASQKK